MLEANRGDLARAESGGHGGAARPPAAERRPHRARWRPACGGWPHWPTGGRGRRRVGAAERPAGRRVRVPSGVVGVIYENRPNVTSDAAGLCLKAGNAAFLRGSASALASNRAIVGILRRAVDKAGLPADAVALVEDTSHETAVAFMRLRGLIDCLIPRGGPALIASLLDHATVPYVLDGDGNCHVYIDAAADLSMALDIVVNAKTQRTGVCNATETLLCTRGGRRVPAGAGRALAGVELRRGRARPGRRAGAGVATESDFATEFLGPKMAVARGRRPRRGDRAHRPLRLRPFRGDRDHRPAAADRFVAEVDAAAVLVNASTRFVDGEELGLGAEVGISTQKLHARGPMGLRELTSVKWVVRGDGQVRP